MRRALVTMFVFMLAFAGCAPTPQVFNEDAKEAFLQASGLTPDDVGMQWYRECRIQGTSKSEDVSDKRSPWDFASPADRRRLNGQVARLARDPSESAYVWTAPCRAQLHFAGAADADALIVLDPVTYRVVEGGPLLTMNTGNALRYYACQKVYVLGDTWFVRNPDCDYT